MFKKFLKYVIQKIEYITLSVIAIFIGTILVNIYLEKENSSLEAPLKKPSTAFTEEMSPPNPSSGFRPKSEKWTGGWLYAGRFLSQGVWEKLRLRNAEHHTPGTLLGRKFSLNYPTAIRIRSEAFEEAGSLGEECFADDAKAKILGAAKSGDEIQVLEIRNVCDGYIWLRVQNVTADNKVENAIKYKLQARAIIIYYKKIADGTLVTKALNNNKIKFEFGPVEHINHGYPANALGCAPDSPIRDIKTLAKALIQSGVNLQYIVPFRRPERKSMRLEIFGHAAQDSFGYLSISQVPTLRVAQIDALTKCPSDVIHN